MLALVFSLVLVPGLYPQAKTDAKTGLDRITGTVQSIDKDKSIITVQQKGTVNISWEVVFNSQTKFSFRNAPSSLDEVKEGRSVICLGKLEGKTRLIASVVDIRGK
jgi:hypothetical protein